jgi:hypothetical protein
MRRFQMTKTCRREFGKRRMLALESALKTIVRVEQARGSRVTHTEILSGLQSQWSHQGNCQEFFAIARAYVDGSISARKGYSARVFTSDLVEVGPSIHVRGQIKHLRKPLVLDSVVEQFVRLAEATCQH